MLASEFAPVAELYVVVVFDDVVDVLVGIHLKRKQVVLDYVSFAIVSLRISPRAENIPITSRSGEEGK